MPLECLSCSAYLITSSLGGQWLPVTASSFVLGNPEAVFRGHRSRRGPGFFETTCWDQVAGPAILVPGRSSNRYTSDPCRVACLRPKLWPGKSMAKMTKKAEKADIYVNVHVMCIYIYVYIYFSDISWQWLSPWWPSFNKIFVLTFEVKPFIKPEVLELE